MTDVSSARSIEAGDHIIDSSFAICTVVKPGIRKRPSIDVETVNEVEHGARRRLELDAGKPIAHRFIVELINEAQPIRAR